MHLVHLCELQTQHGRLKAVLAGLKVQVGCSGHPLNPALMGSACAGGTAYINQVNSTSFVALCCTSCRPSLREMTKYFASPSVTDQGGAESLLFLKELCMQGRKGDHVVCSHDHHQIWVLCL